MSEPKIIAPHVESCSEGIADMDFSSESAMSPATSFNTNPRTESESRGQEDQSEDTVPNLQDQARHDVLQSFIACYLYDDEWLDFEIGLLMAGLKDPLRLRLLHLDLYSMADVGATTWDMWRRTFPGNLRPQPCNRESFEYHWWMETEKVRRAFTSDGKYGAPNMLVPYLLDHGFPASVLEEAGLMDDAALDNESAQGTRETEALPTVEDNNAVSPLPVDLDETKALEDPVLSLATTETTEADAKADKPASAQDRATPRCAIDPQELTMEWELQDDHYLIKGYFRKRLLGKTKIQVRTNYALMLGLLLSDPHTRKIPLSQLLNVIYPEDVAHLEGKCQVDIRTLKQKWSTSVSNFKRKLAEAGLQEVVSRLQWHNHNAHFTVQVGEIAGPVDEARSNNVCRNVPYNDELLVSQKFSQDTFGQLDDDEAIE